MDERVREGLLLFKEYCKTFGLKPTRDDALLDPYQGSDGAILMAVFLDEGKTPPVVSVLASGDIMMEQDEDLLQPGEQVTDVIDPSVIRVAIANKKRIHAVLQ